jgi:hypothetical protein
LAQVSATTAAPGRVSARVSAASQAVGGLASGPVRRAGDLEGHGLQPYDALHVACAEVAADVLLTTDDRLVRKARDPNSGVRVRVANPLRWVEEVLGL